MAAGILLLLKWLGILLLVVIGFVLGLIACFLFVPVRYFVYIKYEGKWEVRGRASWLLHCIHFSIQVKDEKESHTLRIFGIPFEMGSRKNKRKQTSKKAVKKKKQNSQVPIQDRKEDQESTKQEKGDETTSVEYDEALDTKNVVNEETLEQKKQKTYQEEKKEKKLFQRIKEFFLLIGRIFVKIYRIIRALWKYIWEGSSEELSNARVALLKEILQDSNTSALWQLVWENVVALWKHSQPRRIKGWIHFGTSDPCTTGQILGVIGSGYSLLGSRVQIVPDFERPVFEGNLEIKGRIRGIVVLLILKRVLWSEEWRHFRQQTDQWKEES